MRGKGLAPQVRQHSVSAFFDGGETHASSLSSKDFGKAGPLPGDFGTGGLNTGSRGIPRGEGSNAHAAAARCFWKRYLMPGILGTCYRAAKWMAPAETQGGSGVELCSHADGSACKLSLAYALCPNVQQVLREASPPGFSESAECGC